MPDDLAYTGSNGKWIQSGHSEAVEDHGRQNPDPLFLGRSTFRKGVPFECWPKLQKGRVSTLTIAFSMFHRFLKVFAPRPETAENPYGIRVFCLSGVLQILIIFGHFLRAALSLARYRFSTFHLSRSQQFKCPSPGQTAYE